MKNKIIMPLICFFVMLFAVPFTAYASENVVSGVFVNKPDLTFELRSERNDKDELSNVYLDDEILTVKESNVFNYDDYSVCCYVMVDVSGSMSHGSLDSVKDSLYQFYKKFGKDDKFVLYTIGESENELLSGGESDEVVKESIDSISTTNDNSYLYSSLNKLYDRAIGNTDFDRKYVVVISDGINWSNETSFSKVYGKYSLRALPIYELIFDNGKFATSSNNSLSEFKDLAIDSGGTYKLCNRENSDDIFAELTDIIDDVNIVKCNAKSNYYDKNANKHTLLLTINEDTVSVNVDISNYIVDETAPDVKSINYNTDKKEFEIVFSESIAYNIDEIKNNIKISKGNDNVSIISTSYDENTYTLYLVTADTQYSGMYTFEFNGITDSSNEKNPIFQTKLEQKVKAASPVFKVIKSTWWIAVIVAFLIALFCILFYLKKKKNVKKITELFETQVEEENIEVKHTEIVKQKHYINSAIKTKRLYMYIETKVNKEKVDVSVENSIIVGRSNYCDVCINDPKLSRQHFVIEIVNDKFLVSNISSTNGTFLNGNKLSTKQLLHNGDKILAGTSVITVGFKE